MTTSSVLGLQEVHGGKELVQIIMTIGLYCQRENSACLGATQTQCIAIFLSNKFTQCCRAFNWNLYQIGCV